jgi:hypothetical protein
MCPTRRVPAARCVSGHRGRCPHVFVQRVKRRQASIASATNTANRIQLGSRYEIMLLLVITYDYLSLISHLSILSKPVSMIKVARNISQARNLQQPSPLFSIVPFLDGQNEPTITCLAGESVCSPPRRYLPYDCCIE